jgi:guanine deaminase
MESEQKKAFMRRAIEISRQKMQENCGGPFGAVIVRDGGIIGEGWNMVTSSHDPTAHAEVAAIRAACRAVGDFSLKGCEIYTSCEPCPMCLAAIYWARIERIYYANTRQDAAAIGFDDAFLYGEIALPEDRRALPSVRLMPAEALSVFEDWRRKADKVHY